jgi:hypothetical protein
MGNETQETIQSKNPNLGTGLKNKKNNFYPPEEDEDFSSSDNSPPPVKQK